MVEDEAIIRMDLVFFLIDEGFEVFEAGNADEAIALLATNNMIQVIVTDVDMPGSMDGLKLSAAVRNRWPPVKIIVMSGHRTVEMADLPEGSLFYAKPYNHTALAASLLGFFPAQPPVSNSL